MKLRLLTLTAAFTVASLAGFGQTKKAVKKSSKTKTSTTKYSSAKKNVVGCSTNEYAMRPTRLDTSLPRGLADNYYLWNDGETLKVKFLSGSPAMRARVFAMAKEWEQYADIHFELAGAGEPSNIRVMLDNKGGHNSRLGSTASQVPDNEKTMNLDTANFYTEAGMHGTVVHEFGHAIGLMHEHFSPLAGIKWNEAAVYADLKRTDGWDEETVKWNLFQEVNVMYTNGSTYDKKSIMHYPVKAVWTTDGSSVDWNYYLSDGDKEFIGKMYPKNGDRVVEVPRMTITDFTTLKIEKDATRGGLVMYPSFNITTAGIAGRVYLATIFYDKDGNALKDTDKEYNIGGIVSSFKTLVLDPNQKLSANKNDPKDFELFIPYSQIPVTSGSEVTVIFRPFIYDKGEWKFLYSSSPMTLSIIK